MPVNIVIAGDGSDGTERASFEFELARLCNANGIGVVLLPDLYHLPESSSIWRKLAPREDIGALACHTHPRPAKWILARHGLSLEKSNIIDLRQFPSVEDAFETLTALEGVETSETPGVTEDLREQVQGRWYPVIDGSRCVNCGHCVEFCLFGVWARDEQGGVFSENPDNCKDGCPACSRVCPQGAIMFPLYSNDAAIAGAPGRIMQPDAEARKMYYVRTEVQCPVCGQSGADGLRGDDARPVCPECGRHAPDAPGQPGDQPVSDTLDEIDALIGELEDMTLGDQH